MASCASVPTSRSCATSSRTTSAMSRHDDWCRGTGCATGSVARQHGVELQFEQQRRLRQLVGLAPLRMQFADMADGAAVEFDARAAARVQRRVGVGHEDRLARRQQRLDVALEVEEVDARSFWPHCASAAEP